jgi:hypothetical protein
LFGILQVSRVFFVILVNIKQYFYVAKNIKSDIKIPDFRQNFQNTKKLVLKKKIIFVHTAKCLKAKKSYCVFHTKKKNNVLACILALITSLLESREHWPIFQKQLKFYFVCLLVFGVRYYT